MPIKHLTGILSREVIACKTVGSGDGAIQYLVLWSSLAFYSYKLSLSTFRRKSHLEYFIRVNNSSSLVHVAYQ